MNDSIWFVLAFAGAYLISYLLMGQSAPSMPRPSHLPPKPQAQPEAHDADDGWYHDIRAKKFVNEITGEVVPCEGGGVFRHIETTTGHRHDSFLDTRPTCLYCRTRIRVDSNNNCVNCGATYEPPIPAALTQPPPIHR